MRQKRTGNVEYYFMQQGGKNDERKNSMESYTEEEKKKVYDFCEEYRTFLSNCKTERECVKEILKEAKEHGYRSLKEVRQSDGNLQAGDKVYVSIMGKTLALFHIGKRTDGKKV